MFTKCLRKSRPRDHPRNVASLNIRDDSGLVVAERSWTSLFKAACSKPLIRLHLRENDMSERHASFRFEDEHSTDSSRDGSNRRRSSRSSSGLTSYSDEEKGSTRIIKEIETELQLAYESLEDAKSREEYEDIYALEVRQIPDIESRLLHSLNEVYVDEFKRADDPTIGPKSHQNLKRTRAIVIIREGANNRPSRVLQRQLERENDFEVSMFQSSFRYVEGFLQGLNV